MDQSERIAAVAAAEVDEIVGIAAVDSRIGTQQAQQHQQRQEGIVAESRAMSIAQCTSAEQRLQREQRRSQLDSTPAFIIRFIHCNVKLRKTRIPYLNQDSFVALLHRNPFSCAR